MRTALTLGLVAGSDVTDLIAGRETDIMVQRAAFKALQAEAAPHKYAEIQLWESGTGIVKYHRFKEPKVAAVAPAPAEAPAPAPATPEPHEDVEDVRGEFEMTHRGRKRR